MIQISALIQSEKTAAMDIVDDTHTTSAFTILNDEDEDSNIITLPKKIPQPLQSLPTSTVSKPNVIVYPTRRVTAINNNNNNNNNSINNNNAHNNNNNILPVEQRQKQLTRSQGHTFMSTRNELRKDNMSASYGNIPRNKGPNKRAYVSEENIADAEFRRRLETKLRRLQREEERKARAQTLKLKPLPQTEQEETPRKPFITVVKTGKFLKPPPEVATRLGLEPEHDDEEAAARTQRICNAKKLYAYASKPKVVRGKDKHQVIVVESAKDGNEPVPNGNLPNGGHSVGHSPRAANTATVAKNVAANAAFIASGVAGMMKFQRKANGAWELQNDGPSSYGNIMHDKRVVRGSNYAQPPATRADGESEAARVAAARKREATRRRARARAAYAMKLRLGSPPPLPGRRHERVQTEKYLEELTAHPETCENITQTDLFLDRPVSPFYVPAKVGVDAYTQIYPGDLFDFDLEVQPILEVLVGKTIEQALIEVLEEEELAALREQQRRYEEIRAAEVAENLRLEEQERRYRLEKERLLAEHEVAAVVQKETEERVAASVLVQGYVADLLPSVLEGLKEDGFLIDNVRNEVDEEFMPWLMKEVSHEMESMVSSRDVLADIVREVLETRNELYRALGNSDAGPHEPSEEEADDDLFGLGKTTVEDTDEI